MKIRMLLLALALLTALAGFATAEKTEEERFIPTVLTEERYQRLEHLIRSSEDRATSQLKGVLTLNYKRYTAADMLTSRDLDLVRTAVHLLRMSAPAELQSWVGDLEEAVWDRDELGQLIEQSLREPEKAEQLNEEYYIIGNLRREDRERLAQVLYGAEGKRSVRGIGYTELDAAMDALLLPPDFREEQAYAGSTFFRCPRDARVCVIRERYRGQSVTRISDGAFSHCDALTEVVIPGTVASLSMYDGFAGLPKLEEVFLDKGLERIGSGTFRGCHALRTVWVPDSVILIDTDAFEDCPNVVLCVRAGSYAEKWCKENGVPCAAE